MKFLTKFLLLTCVLTFLFSVTVYATENNQDLVNIIKPSTVQIVASAKGLISIPNFIFDYEKNTISSTTKINDFSTTTINTKSEGVGFIISEDGVIVTHSQTLVGTIHMLYRKTTEKYLLSIGKNSEDSGYFNAYKTIYDYIKENSIRDLNNQVTVLRPNNNDYDAKILYADSSFEHDNAVALIKIEAGKLPTITLSDSLAALGENLYSMSYPPLKGLTSEPIFNQGVVNNIQGNIYQTNLSLPEEAKGSPVVDQEGKILGMLSSAGIMIPRTFITEALNSKNLILKQSAYSDHYMAGVTYMKDNHCRLAIEEFIKAQDVNRDFLVEEYVKPKIDTCNTIIASGQSRDTIWDEIIFALKNNTSSIYLWIIVFVLIIILLFCNIYFLRRLRKDENKINKTNGLGKTIEENAIQLKINSDDSKSNISTELPIKQTFDFSQSEFSKKTIKINSMLKKPEKVNVMTRVESAPDKIKTPKTIQPDDSLVVIASFKTLSAPITQRPKKTTELQKTIKTDLPPVKKEDMKMENSETLVKTIKRK